MKKGFSTLCRINLIIVILAVFASCTSFSVDSYNDLSENELFIVVQQKRLRAITDRNYEETIELYRYYIDKFNSTESLYRVMEARYEIGYCLLYLERHEEAEKQFRDIISDYENNDDIKKNTPQWIPVLSKQLKDKILKARTEKILEESEKLKKREERRNRRSQQAE